VTSRPWAASATLAPFRGVASPRRESCRPAARRGSGLGSSGARSSNSQRVETIQSSHITSTSPLAATNHKTRSDMEGLARSGASARPQLHSAGHLRNQRFLTTPPSPQRGHLLAIRSRIMNDSSQTVRTTNCSRLSCRRNTIASKASNDAIGVHARAHRRRRTPCATLLTCQNSHPYLSDLRTQRITSMKKAQTSIRLLAPSKPRIPNRSRRGSSEADCAPVSKTYVPNTSINQNPQNPAAKAQNRQVDTVRLLMLPRSATEDNSHPQIRRPH